MSLILFDGDWDVDGTASYSWHIFAEVSKTVDYAWDILTVVAKTLSYSWTIGETILKALSYSWHIINTVDESLEYSWRILTQAISSKYREIFRKDARTLTIQSSGQKPIISDIKRHRWWRTK